MITAGRMRAAQALLGLDRQRAERSGRLSSTIQRMKACDRVIRGYVGSPMKLANALAASSIELIGNNARSITGHRDVLFVS